MTEKRKILVVDDEQDILDFLYKVLNEAFDVRLANGGATGISVFQKEEFNLVLTDVRMPDVDGIMFLRTIKKISPQCEIILMTGSAEMHMVIEALNEGAFAFVLKPLDIKAIFHRIDQAVSVLRGRENVQMVLKELKNELVMQTIFAQRLSALAAVAGGIAHELNQPLNGIGIYAATLHSMAESGKELDSSAIGEVAKDIIHEVKRADGVIKHMREFSSGSNVHEKEILNVKKAVQRSMELFSVQLSAKGIGLEIDIPENLEIMANQNRFEQVIINLVSNSKDSISEKIGVAGADDSENYISICAFGNDESVMLDIKDTGCGIPEKLEDTVFDPFVTGKKTVNGSGLGLAICRKILSDINSKIELLNTGPDGTTFRISFPKA